MKPRPPNILLTIADDQRAGAMGCSGRETLRTPSLDALARRGLRFASAYHLGSCHGAVCAPSRAMLFTGLPYFLLDHSLLNARNPIGGTAAMPPMLGERLAERGYRTFATGKWHNGTASFQRNFQAGKNIFFGGMADHWFTPVHDFSAAGEYPAEAYHHAEGFSTEVFARSAIDFIHEQRDADRPFFCYCAFTAPHDPRTPPDEFRRRYDPARIQLPPNIVARHPFDQGFAGARHEFDNGYLATRDELLLGTPRDPKLLQRTTAEYYGMIEHMDEWIGRIHHALAEAGLAENTIVVHTSDHGLAVGQHGLLGKQNLYEHSMRVPLLIAGPEVPQDSVSGELCYQHDLNPTLLSLAGAETPDGGAFRDLLATARGDLPARGCLGGAFAGTQRMIRDERYKLIEYRVGAEHATQLFDLRDDPWETRNLAANPACKARVENLRTALRAWRTEVGDTQGGFLL